MMSEVIIEVCEYFSNGLSTYEIARKMHMSQEFVIEIIDQYYEEFMDGGDVDGSEGN